MTKNTVFLIVVLVGLAAAYMYWFTGMFVKPTITILAQVRPTRTAARAADPNMVSTYPVSFAFESNVKMTELRVVSIDDEKTNKYPRALWHMISDSNSVPTRALMYGQRVQGMKPKVPNARPQPLDPDVKYRLYVVAGSAKGQIDFTTKEIPNPGQ